MQNETNPDMWRSGDDWRKELEKAGLLDKLAGFTDLLTGNKRPGGYGQPAIVDAVLFGKHCDVYHTNMDGQEKTTHLGDRVYIHIKD